MKTKILALSIGLFFSVSPFAFADQITLSPSVYTDPSQDGVYVSDLSSNQGVEYNSNGLCENIDVPDGPPNGVSFQAYTTFTPMQWDNAYTGNTPPQVFHIVTMASGYSSCSDAPATYDDALTDPAFISSQTIYLNNPPCVSINSVDCLISSATSSFAASAGFSMDDVGLWMYQTVAEPIIGTGLATLYELRWYILALISISILVFFYIKIQGSFFKH